jgi:signal transduction histidine kinase
VYNKLGWAYRLSYPDSTIHYSNIVLNSNASGSEKATALNFRGIAYSYKTDFAGALMSYRQALDMARQAQDSVQMAYSYNNLGRLFLSQGDRVKAHSYVNDALEIFAKKQDSQGMGYCYMSLVQLYELQNDTTKILDLLHKTLAIRQEINDVHGQISIYQELANFSKKSSRYNEAEQDLQRAMALSESVQDQISIAEINLSLAELWYHQEDYSQSMKYLRKALTAAGASNNTKILSAINLLLAKNYYNQGKFRQARIYLLDVVDTTVNEVSLNQQVEAYFFLTNIFKEVGQYPKALKYFQDYIAAKDSLHDIEKAIAVERLENRLVLEEQDKKYELLKASEARNLEVLQQAKFKMLAKNIILTLVLLLLVTLLAFYWRVRHKNRQLEGQKNQIEDQNRKIISQNLQITQQNEELFEQNHRLQAIDQERETLLSIVTHDLKAPFQRIKGLAEILATSIDEEHSENQRYLDMIRITSQDGSSLVNNLLNTSVLEKKQTLSLEEINLEESAKKLKDAFESQLQAKNMNLQLQIESGLSIQSDPLFLSQILDNLVSNAIKYSPSNTRIHINAFQLDKDKVRISVQDQGPGFSEEDKKHLYQKFKRLSAQPTNGESSHGLGLAIVKILSERLHSTIELSSEPGHGSTFILTCPRKLKPYVQEVDSSSDLNDS